MPLKIIGAGLGRTGTLSMKQALEDLGFVKCYHMTEVFAHPDHVPVWDAAARGEKVDWEQLFAGYQATVDWPGCEFFEEYARLYPDAKVILTVRDPERWHQSVLQTIFAVRTMFESRFAVVPPKMRAFGRMVDRLIWSGKFHGRFADKAHAIDVFNQHTERVKAVIPAEKLLIFDVKDGWEPLCSFLNVPVPAGKPFPHVNDTKEFQKNILRGMLITKYLPLAVLAIVALVLVGLAIKRWG